MVDDEDHAIRKQVYTGPALTQPLPQSSTLEGGGPPNRHCGIMRRDAAVREYGIVAFRNC